MTTTTKYNLPDKLFLTRAEICQATGFSRSKLDLMVAEGGFPSPSPRASTPRMRYWLRENVVRWLDRQCEGVR